MRIDSKVVICRSKYGIRKLYEIARVSLFAKGSDSSIRVFGNRRSKPIHNGIIDDGTRLQGLGLCGIPKSTSSIGTGRVIRTRPITRQTDLRIKEEDQLCSDGRIDIGNAKTVKLFLLLGIHTRRCVWMPLVIIQIVIAIDNFGQVGIVVKILLVRNVRSKQHHYLFALLSRRIKIAIVKVVQRLKRLDCILSPILQARKHARNIHLLNAGIGRDLIRKGIIVTTRKQIRSSHPPLSARLNTQHGIHRIPVIVIIAIRL